MVALPPRVRQIDPSRGHSRSTGLGTKKTWGVSFTTSKLGTSQDSSIDGISP
jgi:hypothetical protein